MQEHSKEDRLANCADMDDLEVLEYVADECERLERLCRKNCQPLARLLNVAAWIAIQVMIARDN
jgi:hypothetical protein